MDFHFILTLSLIVLTLLVVLKNKARTKRLPPGPWKLPIIGNLHQLGDSPHKSIQLLSRKHGSMMFLQLGAVPTLVISSADAAMAIFKGGGTGHDVVFSGSPIDLYVAKKFSYNLNSISFAPYGDLWREMRKIAMVELLSSKRVNSFRTVREEEVAAMVDHIGSTSSTVNLSKLSMLLANNVVCRVAFGKKYGGRDGGGGGKCRFNSVMHETQVLLGAFLLSDYFPWMGWLNKFNGVEARVEKCFNELDKLYDEVIEDHLVPTRSTVVHEDIVDVLLRFQKDPSQVSLNNQQIKGILTDMFIAETDTTASTLVWTFTEIIRNPPCMQKVQYEVREVANGRNMIEESDLPKLNYLQLIIKEALRLHPPVPLSVPRETTEDCIIGDYEISAKTRIIMDVRSIGLDPKYWKNPNEFRPERFINNIVDFKGKHFEFLPFGVGRRGCPGLNFAIVLVQLVIANFLNRFDWKLPDGMRVEDVNMEEDTGLTMFKKTPLCLVATRVV